jgi:hypothetical protein
MICVLSERVLKAKSTGEPLHGPRTWFEQSLKDAKLEAFRWHDFAAFCYKPPQADVVAL